ncbi:MAG: thioredoxin family protein [Phycisphaeraceae bacterium]
MTTTPSASTAQRPVLNDRHFLRDQHEAALDWNAYLATGNNQQQEGWQTTYDRVSLTDRQKQVVGGIERDIKAIFLSGIWCGDCVRQGPMVQRIAEASGGKLDVRYADRDVHSDLQSLLTINAGKRVPVMVFCAEDFELVSTLGDKPLSRYRILAKQKLGASCPLPGAEVPKDDLEAELADWVNEVERVSLILRLSTRLREKHGD